MSTPSLRCWYCVPGRQRKLVSATSSAVVHSPSPGLLRRSGQGSVDSWVALIKQGNWASLALFEGSGFRHEGCLGQEGVSAQTFICHHEGKRDMTGSA